MLDDHSELEPPDPIPNSEVKRLSADGSVGFPHVRVGHRQALKLKYPESAMVRGIFCSPQKLEALADALTVMVTAGVLPAALRAPVRASSSASCLRLKLPSSGWGCASARPSDLADSLGLRPLRVRLVLTHRLCLPVGRFRPQAVNRQTLPHSPQPTNPPVSLS